MNIKLLQFTSGKVLTLTLASSLMVLLGACASTESRDQSNSSTLQPTYQQQAVAQQADEDRRAAEQRFEMEQQHNARVTAQMALADNQARAARRQDRAAVVTARVAILDAELSGMGAQHTDAGMVFTLEDHQFSHGRTQLQPGTLPNLERLADFIRRHPEVKAAINGYSDNAGSFDANQAMSQGRASAVEAKLELLGVPAANLSTHAYGQIGWLASNQTAQGRQMNRRVEIVINVAGKYEMIH